MPPNVKNQKNIFVPKVPLTREISSRKVLPKLEISDIKFADVKPAVVPRVTKSIIVLKLGNPCLISKSRKGLKVIEKPIIEKKAMLGNFFKFELKTTIRPVIAIRIEAK